MRPLKEALKDQTVKTQEQEINQLLNQINNQILLQTLQKRIRQLIQIHNNPDDKIIYTKIYQSIQNRICGIQNNENRETLEQKWNTLLNDTGDLSASPEMRLTYNKLIQAIEKLPLTVKNSQQTHFHPSFFAKTHGQCPPPSHNNSNIPIFKFN